MRISTKKSRLPNRNQEYKPLYGTTLWRATRLQILDRDNYLCQMCGSEANTVDHIVPVKKGGHFIRSNNLRSLCESCHAKKSNQDKL